MGYPFLEHPVCSSDSDRGITWGVLTTPSMKYRVGVLRGQHVVEEIRCPGYLIGSTSEGAVRLHQEPEKHLPLRQLIFLHCNNDILTWLLENHGQYPLDLLVVESRHKNGYNRSQVPEPVKGRYPFLNRNLGEYAVGIVQADEDEHEHGHEHEH